MPALVAEPKLIRVAGGPNHPHESTKPRRGRGSVSHAKTSLVHLGVGGLFSKKLSEYWGWVGGLEAMFAGDYH